MALRHNLGTVVSFEVYRTLAKKRFWILTLLVPVAIGIVFALILVSNSAAENRIALQKNAKFSFTYIDHSGDVDQEFVKLLGGETSTDQAQSLADVKAGRLSAFFVYPNDPTSQAILVYGVDMGLFENGKYGSVATQILVLSAQKKIGSTELVDLAQGRVKVEVTAYKEGQEVGGVNSVIPPMLFLLIFYAVIILLGNQMLSSTLEEKENRVTEMILTAVSAKTLIVGKIISLFTVGLVQMVVFIAPIIFGYIFFRSSLDLPSLDLSALVFDPKRMIIGTLLLFGGFILFTGTLVTIGASMPSAKEAGVFFGALMMLMVIPFYSIPLVVSDPQALIVQIFTFFPFSAPITAMLRNAFGSLGLLTAFFVVTELFLVGALVLRLAVQLFRFGSIEYTKKLSLRAVIDSWK